MLLLLDLSLWSRVKVVRVTLLAAKIGLLDQISVKTCPRGSILAAKSSPSRARASERTKAWAMGRTKTRAKGKHRARKQYTKKVDWSNKEN